MSSHVGRAALSVCAALRVMKDLLDKVQRLPDFSQQFYGTFYLELLQHMFSVATNTEHMAGAAGPCALPWGGACVLGQHRRATPCRHQSAQLYPGASLCDCGVGPNLHRLANRQPAALKRGKGLLLPPARTLPRFAGLV